MNVQTENNTLIHLLQVANFTPLADAIRDLRVDYPAASVSLYTALLGHEPFEEAVDEKSEVAIGSECDHFPVNLHLIA